MRTAIPTALVLGIALALVTSCGGTTKEDIVTKAKNVSTKAELEKTLGKPSDIAKLGPLEKWTYKASNGKVVFIIVGDKVTLETTGGSEDAKEKEKEKEKK
jgi:hypothetical protein